jgi:hypothetical protein
MMIIFLILQIPEDLDNNFLISTPNNKLKKSHINMKKKKAKRIDLDE